VIGLNGVSKVFPAGGLAGRNALVTGTSRGIGGTIADALEAEGARVLRHTRSDGEITGDLATAQGVAEVARQTRAAVSELHLLVHNAAVNPRPRETLDELELETYRAVQAVNVEAPIFLTRALLDLLRATGDAHVIVVSSEAGRFSNGMQPTGLSYRVSKAAVNAFTLVASLALREDGIRINAVHPGWVRSDMGGPSAPLSLEEGARTVVALALDNTSPTGQMFDSDGPTDW
jgi:NAD(P)-dependent dehydrogenase (short-subunit alcohol dehydrogenase family)